MAGGFSSRLPMPIYEFQCGRCGARKEALMRLSDPDPVECPECHEPALKRLMSAPSFRLSGSGWYETDFKKDGKRNLAGDKGESKPEAAEAKSDTKSDTKTEAKPESKTEAKPVAKPEATPAAAAPAKPSGAGD
jgi:putative FmdB family regulatory protein